MVSRPNPPVLRLEENLGSRFAKLETPVPHYNTEVEQLRPRLEQDLKSTSFGQSCFVYISGTESITLVFCSCSQARGASSSRSSLDGDSSSSPTFSLKLAGKGAERIRLNSGKMANKNGLPKNKIGSKWPMREIPGVLETIKN